MDYCNFMQAMDMAPWNPEKCDKCGGVGLVPVGCCSGADCGCMGQPVDYEPCSCNCEEPTEEQLLEWHKKWEEDKMAQA